MQPADRFPKLAFNAPAMRMVEHGRRGAFVAARRPAAQWQFLEAKHPSKRMGASVLLAGKPVNDKLSVEAILRTAFKGLLYGGLAIGGLLLLLHVTSAFEDIMEVVSGAVAGKSTLVAGIIGLAVGALHTFAGPDHLAGLAPLVIGQGRSTVAAFGLGALWGSGHATGQLLLGFGCLLAQIGIFRLAWADAFTQASTFLIGASLVAIGILGFRETRKFSLEESASAEGSPKRRKFGLATFLTGVLHGLSLDALLFISPALALPRLAAILHIVGVSIGTLLSMGVYTTVLNRLATQGNRLHLVSSGASVIAVLLGACILLAACGLSFGLPGI